MKQKAEITFEEQETVILRQRDSYLLEFCPLCQVTVRLVTPEIMAALVAVSQREIFRLIEEGQIHFVETNRIYACLGCYGKNWRFEIQ
ncbi:MAG TPA: hypothetical protein VL866_04905 [Pyrinomonadaceae bacterium]|nr:hypothetical protein [Pyrinomonadaceae bacterium]